jgi:hypothetical protein
MILTTPMPATHFSGSGTPKFHFVSKHLIKKLNDIPNDLFFPLIQWGLVVARREMSVRQLTHRNGQFAIVIID